MAFILPGRVVSNKTILSGFDLEVDFGNCRENAVLGHSVNKEGLSTGERGRSRNFKWSTETEDCLHAHEIDRRRPIYMRIKPTGTRFMRGTRRSLV